MTPDLDGWTPVEVEVVGGRPSLRWRYTDGFDFTEPFFQETVELCLREPFRLLFWRRTDLDEIPDHLPGAGLPLVGLVFHVSRCGSTLISQALGSLLSVLSLSEPPPIDQLIRGWALSPGVSEEEGIEAVRRLVRALGQPRHPDQRHLVIKLDPWALFLAPIITRAFPDVPAIVVYRDPLEVLVSQLDHRSYHMVPGALPPAWTGIGPHELATLGQEELAATILGRLYEEARLGVADGSLQPIAYPTLPGAVTDVVAPLFGIPIGPQDDRALAAVFARNAKNPFVRFDADSAGKQQRATDRLRAACDRLVSPAYLALEAMNAGQGRALS